MPTGTSGSCGTRCGPRPASEFPLPPNSCSHRAAAAHALPHSRQPAASMHELCTQLHMRTCNSNPPGCRQQLTSNDCRWKPWPRMWMRSGRPRRAGSSCARRSSERGGRACSTPGPRLLGADTRTSLLTVSRSDIWLSGSHALQKTTALCESEKATGFKFSSTIAGWAVQRSWKASAGFPPRQTGCPARKPPTMTRERGRLLSVRQTWMRMAWSSPRRCWADRWA